MGPLLGSLKDVSHTLFAPFFLASLNANSGSTKCRLIDGVLHCYHLFDDVTDFDGAVADCSSRASRGAHLVTISSEEEFDFVMGRMNEGKFIKFCSL